MAILAIPLAEILIDAAVAAGGALLRAAAANAVPAAIGVGTAAVIVKATDSSKPATATNTTTVVGKGKLNCGENGDYEKLLEKESNGMDRDHVPSKAALQEAARNYIEREGIKLTGPQADMLFGEKGLISMRGKTIAIPKGDHKGASPTWFWKNNKKQISKDAEDLQKAAKKDTDAIQKDAKEMDDPCKDVYKKVADEINKKTHEQYENDFQKLIDEVKKVKPKP